MSRNSWGVGISSCGAATLKFDLLGSLDFGGGYEDLLPYSEVLDVGGSAVRVLTLEKQVELKPGKLSCRDDRPSHEPARVRSPGAAWSPRSGKV